MLNVSKIQLVVWWKNVSGKEQVYNIHCSCGIYVIPQNNTLANGNLATFCIFVLANKWIKLLLRCELKWLSPFRTDIKREHNISMNIFSRFWKLCFTLPQYLEVIHVCVTLHHFERKQVGFCTETKQNLMVNPQHSGGSSLQINGLRCGLTTYNFNCEPCCMIVISSNTLRVVSETMKFVPTICQCYFSHALNMIFKH